MNMKFIRLNSSDPDNRLVSIKGVRPVKSGRVFTVAAVRRANMELMAGDQHNLSGAPSSVREIVHGNKKKALTSELIDRAGRFALANAK